MRVIELTKNECWVGAFEKEAKLLSDSLGGYIIALHHVGSTSIPGIYAKPVIDIIMEVLNVHDLDVLNSKFIEIGYEPKGEFGIPGRRYFTKGGNQRSHHIHAFHHDSNEVLRHLVFRDYLIAKSQRAQDYELLKLQLAKQFRESPQDYSAGKNELIQEIESEALAWHSANTAINPTKKATF